MAEKKFIIAKIRGMDIYKVYLNNKERSYVGQFFCNEEDMVKIANDMDSTKKTRTGFKIKAKNGNKDVSFFNIKVGEFRETIDESNIGEEIGSYIKAVKKEREKNDN